jgi:hypothetical protein
MIGWTAHFSSFFFTNLNSPSLTHSTMPPKIAPTRSNNNEDEENKKMPATTPPKKAAAVPAKKKTPPSAKHQPLAAPAANGIIGSASPFSTIGGDVSMMSVAGPSPAATGLCLAVAAMTLIKKKPFDPNQLMKTLAAGSSHFAGSGKSTFLESLGLKSAKKNKTSDVNRGVHIEAVITNAPCGGVLFYFVNDVTTNNSGRWPEKLTADALRNLGAWVQEIGIQDEVYKLIINGVEVRNNRRYFKCGFFIPLDEMPTPDTKLQMMSFAADNLNGTPGNTVPTSVDMAFLFPLGCDPVVWSTFVGDEKDCQLCLEHTIGPDQVPMPGYWELHSSFNK